MARILARIIDLRICSLTANPIASAAVEAVITTERYYPTVREDSCQRYVRGGHSETKIDILDQGRIPGGGLSGGHNPHPPGWHTIIIVENLLSTAWPQGPPAMDAAIALLQPCHSLRLGYFCCRHQHCSQEHTLDLQCSLPSNIISVPLTEIEI